ncbi:MAG: STAS domain-containing protein [Alphaproteobacteria bacterium]|nr:STAS domain-containing protein [Alphaproteobacteria bacterium]
METKELKIEQIKDNGILTCKLSGWLDPNTSPKLVDSINLDKVTTLIFDMQNVEYVFSAGLRAFLIFQKFIDLQNGTMKLINVSDDIRSIFECTGFESMLETK